MTGNWPRPQVAPDRAGELLGRRCIRCGAVGTHYLTCPSLRLPPGYRHSAEHGPECLCGRPAGSCDGDHFSAADASSPAWPTVINALEHLKGPA